MITKNKRMLWGILGLVMLCGLFCTCRIAFAAEDNGQNVPVQSAIPDTVNSGDYCYQVLDENAKTATLRKIRNYGEEVVIPAEIDGYRIISIGAPENSRHYEELPGGELIFDYEKYAVLTKEDNTVKRLVIPEGICCIKKYAFNVMKKLEVLHIPQTMSNNSLSIECNNFMSASCIKEVSFPGEICVAGFDDSVIDKLTINGSFTGWDEDNYDYEMRANVNTLKVNPGKDNGEKVNVCIDGKVKNVIVNKNIKRIGFYAGTFDNVLLENSKTELVSDDEMATVKKVTSTIKTVKTRKKAGRYIYSWKPLCAVTCGEWYINQKGKIIVTRKGSYNVKYTVYAKNKKGKYKKLKTVNKAELKLSKKAKLKVGVILRGKNAITWNK